MTSKLALDALDVGRAWGDAAYGFQWEDTKAILDESSPPYHFLTRARGSSKTTDLAGFAFFIARASSGSRNRRGCLGVAVTMGSSHFPSPDPFLLIEPHKKY